MIEYFQTALLFVIAVALAMRTYSSCFERKAISALRAEILDSVHRLEGEIKQEQLTAMTHFLSALCEPGGNDKAADFLRFYALGAAANAWTAIDEPDNDDPFKDFSQPPNLSGDSDDEVPED